MGGPHLITNLDMSVDKKRLGLQHMTVPYQHTNVCTYVAGAWGDLDLGGGGIGL